MVTKSFDLEIRNAAGPRQWALVCAFNAQHVGAIPLINFVREQELMRFDEAPGRIDHQRRARHISSRAGNRHTVAVLKVVSSARLRESGIAAQHFTVNGLLEVVIRLFPIARIQPQLGCGVEIELGVELVQVIDRLPVHVVVVCDRRTSCVRCGDVRNDLLCNRVDAVRRNEIVREWRPALAIGCSP